MVYFDLWHERDVCLSVVTHRPDEATYARTAREAYDLGLMKRGRDRVTLFGPDVDFTNWPVSGIFDVQRAFSGHETLLGLRGVYTCVLVSDDPQLEPVIEAYRAIWREEMGPLQCPTYLTVRNLQDAERLMSLTGLEEAFAPLMRRAGLARTGHPMREGP